MKQLIKTVIQKLSKYHTFLVLFFLVTLSVLSSIYYLQDGKNLAYGDAVSRLNISRKIIDNLTPGLGQLGSVWLPLPQVLMLPFIWNNYLWHTGIAGAIMSMAAYIIGGFYMYKSIKLITNSSFISLFPLSIYALNINLLYFQTTAMSETVFIGALAAAMYYFLIFIKTNNKYFLIPAAIAVGAMSLTRYEGLAVLLASIPMVYVNTLLRTRKFVKAESWTILYAVLACFGFVCWTLYLTAIFGDPLSWMSFYAGGGTSPSSGEIVYTQGISFFDAWWKYMTAIIWMAGLIPVILSVFGIFILVYKSIKNKTFYFLPVFLPLSIFLFMMLSLMRNTPIHQPILNLSSILSDRGSDFREYNIRYGLLMLPMVTLLCAYVVSIKNKIVTFALFFLLCIQFYSYIKPSYTVIFQLPQTMTANTRKSNSEVVWLNNHYDKGLIMISAMKHDPQMFALGYDYKTYIHEGTQFYWKESTKDPRKYATWVVMIYSNNEDQVTRFLKDSQILKLSYDLEYNEGDIRIYKIKDKPYSEIKF